MDLGHPYLTEQLIAYIGNKRALLPFLHGVLSGLVEEPSRAAFLDPFAGSGAVSRLARMMGFRVHANDWEPYSLVINSCHLGVGKSELQSLFGDRGGLGALLAELNDLPALPSEEYISRHYAPRATATADWRTERLFYTRENALAIDALRERIERLRPGEPAEPRARSEKHVLLASLLYQAATHTNTSGVFKACHKGFGGHGRDALTRILAPIRLQAPVLVDAPAPSTMDCMDAASFLRARPGDICYLDPPYAGHQYGSNYFMLNTIALWDKPPVSDERGPDGRFRQKAGIRPDWTRTRSAFCYRSTALPAMKEIVEAADCRWLVVSYSNEGAHRAGGVVRPACCLRKPFRPFDGVRQVSRRKAEPFAHDARTSSSRLSWTGARGAQREKNRPLARMPHASLPPSPRSSRSGWLKRSQVPTTLAACAPPFPPGAARFSCRGAAAVPRGIRAAAGASRCRCSISGDSLRRLRSCACRTGRPPEAPGGAGAVRGARRAGGDRGCRADRMRSPGRARAGGSAA